MALHIPEAEQQLSLCVGSGNGGVDGVSISNNGGDEGGGSKAPRLPRWTRQEILVLIQGKKVAEGRVRRGRAAGLAYGGSGSASVEPKWATVSSYCKRHGVNRGPVQCRKRWSNLAGDFKKIKEWESLIKDESESFWVMRSDLRRERKLPGFFDKEVYDILDGSAPAPQDKGEVEAEPEEDADAEAEIDAEAVFDSGRSAAADDGLFSDYEQPAQEETDKDSTEARIRDPRMAVPMTISAPNPISEKQYQPFTIAGAVRANPGNNEKQPEVNPEMGSTSHEGWKRRRILAADDGEGASLQEQLIQVLERNGRILGTQLEAQNINLKLDREERKDHASSLVAVLNKLADALGRIADKL